MNEEEEEMDEHRGCSEPSQTEAMQKMVSEAMAPLEVELMSLRKQSCTAGNGILSLSLLAACVSRSLTIFLSIPQV